jgi:hypothetical protein
MLFNIRRPNPFLAQLRRRPRSLPLLKHNALFALPKPAAAYPTTSPRNFNRLWAALRPHRAGFKSFAFFPPFQSLSPEPYKNYGNFFRVQSRAFIFWYEFAQRKYCVTLDLGIKQKKTFSETALWLRSTRRGAPKRHRWWAHWQKRPSFVPEERPLLRLNANGLSPLFVRRPRAAHSERHWFEESLPHLRVFAWNFYSRLTTERSALAPLSQSAYDSRVLQRRSPMDSTTFWLASPVHDYSLFIKNYFANRTVILPERFFQFRRRRRFAAAVWSQNFFRFWNQIKFPAGGFFPAANFIFKIAPLFLKLRLWRQFSKVFLFFSKFAAIDWTSSFSVVGFLGKHISPAAAQRPLLTVLNSTRAVRRVHPTKFFVPSTLFRRYLRRKFFRGPKIMPYAIKLSGRLRQTHFMLLLFFRQFLLRPPSHSYQLLVMWAHMLSERALSLSVRGNYLKLVPLWKKKVFRKRSKFFRRRRKV